MARITSLGARELLDVDPDASGFTCVGYAPSKGRRCRISIAERNRDSACRYLDRLDRCDPMSTQALDLLQNIAQRTLCTRWHQDQQSSMVRQWRQKLANAHSVNSTARPSRIELDAPVTNRSVVSRAPGPEARRSSQTTHSRGRPDDHVLPTPPLTPPPVRDTTPTTTSARRSAISPTRASRRRPSSPLDLLTPEAEPVSWRTLEDDTNPAPPSPSFEAILFAYASQQETSPSAALRVPEPERPPRRSCQTAHVARQPIPADCPICLEPALASDELVWCKRQCGMNYHKTCFDIWLRQRSSDGLALTCCNCRQTWHDPCEHDTEDLRLAPGKYTLTLRAGDDAAQGALFNALKGLPREVLALLNFEGDEG